MMGLIIHKEGENKSSSPSGGNKGAAGVEAIMQNLSKYCYQSACCLVMNAKEMVCMLMALATVRMMQEKSISTVILIITDSPFFVKS